MKNFLATVFLFLATAPGISNASNQKTTGHHETRIIEVKIDYARALSADDSRGFNVYMAAIGGQIVFEGHAPVFATIKVGGQSYTVTADKEGFYSAFVFTNGYNRFTVEGWSPHEPAGNRVMPIAEGEVK